MADLERELLERLQGVQAAEASKPPLKVQEEPTIEVETLEPSADKNLLAKATADHGVTVFNIFRHRDAHPYILDFMLLQKYGPEWLVWEPETLELHIQKDFRGGVSDLNFSKVQAMKTLHLVDTFWQQWEVFLWCTMPLNGVMPDFEMMQVPTAAQCLVAIDVANRVRDDVPWSGEIKAYLATVFQHDGVFCPQAPAQFVEVDTTGLPIPCAEINKRWPEVRLSRRAPEADTIAGVQLSRLLVVDEYLEESRSRLRRQESLIPHA